MVGRVGPERAGADRGPSLPRTIRSGCRTGSTGTSSGSIGRSSPGCASAVRAAPRPGQRRPRLVGDRLRPARSGRRPARRPVPLPRRSERGRGRGGPRPVIPPTRAVRPDRAPVPAVQHDLPARGRARVGAAGRAARMLLIPDLLGYWLTGGRVAEVTNASTTGLLDVHRRTWDRGADRHARSARRPVPAARPRRARSSDRSATTSGRRPGCRDATLLTLVGSHDTASAVVGVPAGDRPFAYIACGTWSLVGVELDAPDPVRGEPAGELHQRGRRRRSDPLPAQRDGPVAAPGVAPDVGAGWEPRAACRTC